MVREPVEDVPPVPVVYADRLDAVIVDAAQQARNAVEERFAADNADVRIGKGLPQKMFPGSERPGRNAGSNSATSRSLRAVSRFPLRRP